MTESIDTRQRLLDAAGELIHASSYREVGVQQICDRAGVRKGSFYHFFPSKRDLALASLDQSHILSLPVFNQLVAALVVFLQFQGAPPEADYRPATLGEGGKIVPGTLE